MCDETKLERWAREGLNRRQFGALGAMAAVSACAPAGEAGNPGAEPGGTMTLPAMSERAVSFATPDGTLDGVFLTPATTPAPAVIWWPDIAGVRESHLDMARMLVGRGHAVLVANPYYRDIAGQPFATFADFVAEKGFASVRPWRDKLSSFAIQRDARAIVRWLDDQPEVDTTRGIGAQGYCMGGPFAVYSAHAVPDRIRAAASFHGGGLVREDEQSPHRLLARSEAAYLFAIAQDDDAEAPNHKTALREAAAAAGRPAQVEVFAGDHGWTVPDSPAYDPSEARRAWEALLKLYGTAL